MLSATTPWTRRCPDRSFARLTYPARGQFSSPTVATRYRPRLEHPSQGNSQLGGPRLSPLPPRGPVASATPETGTRPSWESRSGLGIHSPSPATSHPAVGEGVASPPFYRAPGPVPALRLGRVPAPNTLRKPGKCWAQPGPAPRAPHPREPLPGLAGSCRSPSPVRPPLGEQRRR